MDTAAHAVFAIGGALGEPEVGEGSEESVGAGRLESQVACQFAHANGVASSREGMQAGEAINEGLVGLLRKHVAIIATNAANASPPLPGIATRQRPIHSCAFLGDRYHLLKGNLTMKAWHRRHALAATLLLTLLLPACDSRTRAQKEAEWDARYLTALEVYTRGDLTTATSLVDELIKDASAFSSRDIRWANAMNLRGVIAYENGDLPRAEACYTAAQARYAVTTGPNDQGAACAAHNLGQLYVQMGQLDKAEPLLKQGLAVRRALLGSSHDDVSLSLLELGWLYVAKKDYDQAESHALDSLKIDTAKYGSGHARTAHATNLLGIVALEGRAQPAKAREHFEKAVAALMSNTEQGFFRTVDAITMNGNLAYTCAELEDWPAAEKALREKARLLAAMGHPDPATTAACFHDLATVLEQQGKTKEAQEFTTQAKKHEAKIPQQPNHTPP